MGSIQVRFSNKFAKQYAKAGGKIRKAFDSRLKLFLQDPLDARLKNHKLSGKLKDYGSINITGDWRAIYLETRKRGSKTLISFEVLGTHSELYK